MSERASERERERESQEKKDRTESRSAQGGNNRFSSSFYAHENLCVHTSGRRVHACTLCRGQYLRERHDDDVGDISAAETA